MRQQHFAVKNVLLAARRNKTYHSTIIILISWAVYSEINVAPIDIIDTLLPQIAFIRYHANVN